MPRHGAPRIEPAMEPAASATPISAAAVARMTELTTISAMIEAAGAVDGVAERMTGPTTMRATIAVAAIAAGTAATGAAMPVAAAGKAAGAVAIEAGKAAAMAV